jgi:hypothetical protein
MSNRLGRVRPALLLLIGIGVLLFVGIGIGGGFVPFYNENKITMLCDDAVHELLTTKDLVELQRAKFLIKWFNCGVRRRL